MKKNYFGQFRLNRELIELYRYAHTEKQAKTIMCREIARRHELSFMNVLCYFDGSKDNFVIKEER